MNIATISKQIRAFADQLDATSEPEKPDPYAELKAAHAAGKVIQYRSLYCPEWRDQRSISWNPPDAPYKPEYRIKPTESAKPEPSFTLPPPPPGVRWHREDGWTADDLPQGYRPLVMGEELQPDDEGNYGDDFFVQFTGGNMNLFPQYHYRTTRPLTFQHAGKMWTWHRPGDPMPCDGDRDVCCLVTKGGRRETNPAKGCYVGWSVTDEKLHFWGVILGWRYAEPQTVPQSSTFFLPGTVIRFPDATDLWGAITAINQDGLVVGDTYQSYQELATSKAMANRSIPLTGKWNPDAWEPCSKTIPA